MQIPQITYASLKEDELERLALVHEDAREFLREKRNREKRRLYFFLGVLITAGIFFYLEFFGKTSVSKTFIQELWVIPEQKPHDGNAVPMPFGGKTPLFVPDLNSSPAINPSSMTQPVSYAASETQGRNVASRDSSSNI